MQQAAPIASRTGPVGPASLVEWGVARLLKESPSVSRHHPLVSRRPDHRDHFVALSRCLPLTFLDKTSRR